MIVKYKNDKIQVPDELWALVKIDTTQITFSDNAVRFILFSVDQSSSISPSVDEWYLKHAFSPYAPALTIDRTTGDDGMQYVQLVLNLTLK